jgi:adenylate kinase
VRPGRDAETLKAHQDLAKARAVQIANALGVPISFVTSGNGNVLAEALSALDAAKN